MAAINHRGLDIPLTRMGAVSSDDLFEEREQAIFDFYERNAGRYRRALDVGANLGIHAILMAKQGWQVRAFEPDPEHFEVLCANRDRNRCGFEAINAAVALADGRSPFVRVLGNGTANHLAGARGAYGEQQLIEVDTVDCRPLWDWADFAKVDCEGMEARLLCTVTAAQARRLEFMVEVGSVAAAEAIFEHFTALGVPLRAQSLGWRRIEGLGQMPTHYQQGSVFIGRGPWA